MHLKRWITGLVLILLFLSVICWFGGYGLMLLLMVASIIALYEYYSIVFTKESRNTSFIRTIMVLSYVMTSVLFGSHLHGVSHASMMVLSVDMVIVTYLLFFKWGVSTDRLNAFFMQLIGMVYIPCFLSFYILIRNSENGVMWVLLVFSVIAAGDIGALYFGTFIGKHKLCPSVSPKKTIEGALGGLFFNLLTGLIFGFIFHPKLSLPKIMMFCIIIGAIGQLGDLFESSLKRNANMKDSGRILPGHGGVLDRIDALIFAGPFAFFFKSLFFN